MPEEKQTDDIEKVLSDLKSIEPSTLCRIPFTPHRARSSLLRDALRCGIKTGLPRGDLLRFGDGPNRRTGETTASEEETESGDGHGHCHLDCLFQ